MGKIYQLAYFVIIPHELISLLDKGILDKGRQFYVQTHPENAFFCIYRKVASSNMSRLEAHAGFFRFSIFMFLKKS